MSAGSESCADGSTHDGRQKRNQEGRVGRSARAHGSALASAKHGRTGLTLAGCQDRLEPWRLGLRVGEERAGRSAAVAKEGRGERAVRGESRRCGRGDGRTGYRALLA